MKKRIILCSLVMVLFFSLDVSAATKFKDVKDTAWYKVYLDKLVNDKVIDGMPDGTFQGQGTLNADQLLKLMVTTVNPYASYERRKTVTEYNGKTTYSYQGTWFEPYMTVLQSMNLIEPIEKTYTNDEGKS
ncbi:MAG: S-layer homology domain-containing protein [Clostridia bacterium]|nr:S-layer homology domain-containing protein [Clostridia bacterium]